MEKPPLLLPIFQQINFDHFDGLLAPPILEWNVRLRTSAGRFTPGSQRFWVEEPAKIEVASYLIEELEAELLIWDTVAHEMIHFWLWVRGKPYGHTKEFLMKMKEMGVSRYNPVPRSKPPKYLYRCPRCGLDFPFRKRVRERACAKCCKKYSNGRYDPRFKLLLDKNHKRSLSG